MHVVRRVGAGGSVSRSPLLYDRPTPIIITYQCTVNLTACHKYCQFMKHFKLTLPHADVTGFVLTGLLSPFASSSARPQELKNKGEINQTHRHELCMTSPINPSGQNDTYPVPHYHIFQY